MSTSLLLTELSTVTFIIDSDMSTTVTLNSGETGAVFAPPLATTYKGTVTWTLSTDPKNTILGSKVALSLDGITVPIVTDEYIKAVEGSGDLAGSKISKVTMNNKKPLCVADGASLSITGDAYYVDSYGTHYMSSGGGSSPSPTNPGYTCTCIFDAVQTVTSGLIS